LPPLLEGEPSLLVDPEKPDSPIPPLPPTLESDRSSTPQAKGTAKAQQAAKRKEDGRVECTRLRSAMG
jgi:hypothetical protein